MSGDARLPFAGFVSTSDTTELRWFAAGAPPTDVVHWFTRRGSAGMVEERCDTYLLDDRVDVGLKRRFRERLELKVRQSVGESVVLGPGLVGTTEVWRKWSPADELVGPVVGDRCLDVHKMVLKRRFTIGGDEVMSADLPPMTTAECDAEVVAVSVGGVEAWTFAFAASGAERDGRHAIHSTWQALLAQAPCPDAMVSSFGSSCGYPEWLAGLTSAGEVAVEPNRELVQ